MIAHNAIVPGMLYAFVDGGTWKTNPGPISWGIVYVRNGVILGEDAAAAACGTEAVAEIMAVIWALERAPREDLVIVGDSCGVQRCIMGLAKPRRHKALWAQAYAALTTRQRRNLETRFEHVRGHSNHPFNGRAHQLARAIARENALSVES